MSLYRYILLAVPSCLLLYIIRKYREKKWGKCTNKVDLSGKIAIVTGGNSGIGYEISKELSARHARVILACKCLMKANEAIKKIKCEVENGDLVAMELDLSSFMSIKDFAKKINKTCDKVDILVNNAGVAYPKNVEVITTDGLEAHFQVNYLGHFFLTDLLLAKLLESDYKRVIVITSSLLDKGSIKLDNRLGSFEERTDLYANSKLANAYFCRELAKRNQDRGLLVYGVCPGWVYTSLFRYSIKWYHYIIIAPIALFFMRSPKQGSETAVYCITESSIESESGSFYRDCKLYKPKHTFSDKVSSELWDKSDNMIKAIKWKIMKLGVMSCIGNNQ